MTTTSATPVATSTPGTVDRLLDAIASGRGGEVAGLYTTDAVLDATVPGWRFSRRGGEAIASEWSGWFATPGRFEELDRLPTPDGEVVRYLVTAEERGVPFAVHHCHLLTLDDATGLIARHRVFCGGRWDAARLAEMEAAEHAH